MDAALKQKWVDALKSGEFRQTTGVLAKDDCYCCLGVLCTVAGAQWTDYEGIGEDAEGFGVTHSYRNVPVLDGECLSSGEDGELGDVGLQKFGMDKEIQARLIEMNDGWKETPQHSFVEIAEYIDKNL